MPNLQIKVYHWYASTKTETTQGPVLSPGSGIHSGCSASSTDTWKQLQANPQWRLETPPIFSGTDWKSGRTEARAALPATRTSPTRKGTPPTAAVAGCMFLTRNLHVAETLVHFPPRYSFPFHTPQRGEVQGSPGRVGAGSSPSTACRARVGGLPSVSTQAPQG